MQNRVEKAVAEKTLEDVKETFGGSEGSVKGLTLYRYDRGFWIHGRDFEFEGANQKMKSNACGKG